MTNLAYTYNFMENLNDCCKQSFAFACDFGSAQASCTFNFNNLVLHTAFVVCIFSAIISLISVVIIDVVSVINVICFLSVIIILASDYLLYKQHLRQ